SPHRRPSAKPAPALPRRFPVARFGSLPSRNPSQASAAAPRRERAPERNKAGCRGLTQASAPAKPPPSANSQGISSNDRARRHQRLRPHRPAGAALDRRTRPPRHRGGGDQLPRPGGDQRPPAPL